MKNNYEKGIDRSCIFANKKIDYCSLHKYKNPQCADCYDYENYWDDYKPIFDDEWSSNQ